MNSRLAVILAAVCLWSGAIGARLYWVQIREHDAYRKMAERQQQDVVHLEPPRGTIYDARGRQLAVSVAVDSAFVNPRVIGDLDRFAGQLDDLPGFERGRIESALDKGRSFAWVARKLDPPAAAELRRRGIDEVGFLEESKRYYPLRESAGQLLGFAGVDNDGLAGLESKYDEELSGRAVSRTVLRDAREGALHFPGLSFLDAEPGSDLYLTIDATVQHIVESELRRTVEESRAKSGTAVLLDPRSGAILAMASAPDFDPNRFQRYPRERWRNRAVMDSFEPGSTFKIFTAAAAIEANLFDPNDVIDCEMGGVAVSGIRINDHKPFGELSFREVLALSSNVGAIKIGLRVGDRRLYDTIRAFGFGSATGVDLAGENPGRVHPLESWRPGRATAYVSFGQGLLVTPLQLVSAVAAVANGGTLYRPYVVRAIGGADGVRELQASPQVLGRPISAATALTVERLLEGVVETGTGELAAVPGYSVAGKTGTAQKADGRNGYSKDDHIASFVGFAPARSPALVGLVLIDEPRGLYHGGEVAAPAFSEIFRRVLPYLGVRPDRPDVPEPPATAEERGRAPSGDRVARLGGERDAAGAATEPAAAAPRG